MEPTHAIAILNKISKRLFLPEHEDILSYLSNVHSWRELKVKYYHFGVGKLKSILSSLIVEKIVKERFLCFSFSESKYSELELFMDEISEDDLMMIQKIRSWSADRKCLKDVYPLEEHFIGELIRVKDDYREFIRTYFI